MTRIAGQALKALGCEIRLATLSLKLDVLIAGLERRYRPDQPRAPKGTPEGGQWIDEFLGLQGLPHDEVVETFGWFDLRWRNRGNDVFKSAST